MHIRVGLCVNLSHQKIQFYLLLVYTYTEFTVYLIYVDLCIVIYINLVSPKAHEKECDLILELAIGI